jgi:hypothetical protein
MKTKKLENFNIKNTKRASKKSMKRNKTYNKKMSGGSGINSSQNNLDKKAITFSSDLRVASRKYKNLKIGASKATKKILYGEDDENCSFFKTVDENITKFRGMESVPATVKRRAEESEFFKKEDEYFKALLLKNIDLFCFKRKVTNDDNEYALFCYNMFIKCLKTPRELHEVLYDLVDVSTTEKMYSRLPEYSQDKLQKRIVQEYADEINENRSKLKTKKDKQAFYMTLVQKDNFKNFSLFIVEVILKTIIDYKEAKNGSPGEKYKNKIVLELYLDDVLKTLLKNSEENSGDENKNSQSSENGGSATDTLSVTETSGKMGSVQDGGATPGTLSREELKEYAMKKGVDKEQPYTLSELKNINDKQIYEGLLDCDKKEFLKEDYERKLDGEDPLGNDYDEEDNDFETLGEATDSPKLLYIVIGSLLLVGLIEGGVFDAPPCMRHTII